MSVREFLVLFMICAIWGLHFVVIKVTVTGVAEPLFYAAVRMSIVALILAPKLKWHGPLMLPVLGAGLGYGALNYAFMFPALQFTTSSAAAVAIELYVPFSILLSILVFKDKIGIWSWLGILLAFAGVAIVALAGPPETAGPYFLLGVFMVVCAAMSEAIGAVLVKKVTGIGPLELLAWFALVGAVVLWPLSLSLESRQLDAFKSDSKWPFLTALAYSAFAVSIIANTCYYWLLQRLPIYIVATGGLMTTVLAVIFSAVLLHDPLTMPLVVGGGLTLVGVAIILMRRKGGPKSRRGALPIAAPPS